MEPGDITIRKLTPADAKELQVISIETFSESFSWGNTAENMQLYLQTAFSSETLGKELNNPESAFYFALCKNVIAGYLKLNWGKAQTDLHNKNGLEIARIYVRQKYQNNKIGKILLDKTVEEANTKSAGYIWLGVWEKNPRAIKFYTSNGFEVYSSHPFMLGNDRQTDIIMKLVL